MSLIKRIWREYIWDEIKEKRDKYFATYYPINLKGSNFAGLHLTFTEQIDIKEVAKIMEKEFDIWISKFPLPLMVMSFDEKGDKISLEKIKLNSELIGYVENKGKNIIKSWDRISDDEFPEKQLTDENIIDVYKGLPYKKRIEKEKNRDKKLKEKINIKRFVNFTVCLWLVVSIAIAFLGWQSFWVGAIAFVYSVYKTIRSFLRLRGYKTKKEKEEQEKMRKMKHYYYHCELNPKAFGRLVAENFEKEERERIQKERESIKG